jgi:hypothetical protein
MRGWYETPEWVCPVYPTRANRVAHTLRLGRDRNGYAELKCQSAENCSFTANLEKLILRYQERQTQSAVISERPAAENATA